MDLTKRDVFSEIDEVMQATEKLLSKRLMRRVYDLGINQRNTETFPTLTSCNALMNCMLEAARWCSICCRLQEKNLLI